MSRPKRVQMQVILPYKFQPVKHHRIRAYLDDGYRIEELQRISDREVVVTLAKDGDVASNGTAPAP